MFGLFLEVLIVLRFSQKPRIIHKDRTKIIVMPNNAVGKQIAGLNADKVTKHIGPDKGGYWQVVEKNRLIFLEGAQFAACPLHSTFKKYPSCRISGQHMDR